MIEIDVVPDEKGNRFRFNISVDGEFVVSCKFTPLSGECVRLNFAEGSLSTEINDALTRKAYGMGYLRMVFHTPPGVGVTRLAILQRKAEKKWCYIIPLEALYGDNH